tara:strand:+ start:4520 stop:5146 length:627 start_codon:yes stop_codon:yes gene_type:complete
MSEIKVNHGEVCTLFSDPLYLSSKPHKLDQKEYMIIRKEQDNTEFNTDGNLLGKDKYLLDKLPLLKKYIQEQIENYFYEILKYGKTQHIYITNSWSNYNKPKTKNHVHTHPNSVVSGVFYVEGEEAPIEFYSDKQRYLMSLNVTEANLYNSNRVWFNIIKNHLYLFPSTLVHGVAPNNSNTTRISIAFNTFIKGPTGSDGAHTRLEIK